MNSIYIIEHLEPKLWPWCIIEYKHISKIVGKENLWFTNIKEKSKILSKYGKVFKESIKSMNLPDTCTLDPESNITLSSKDSQKFKYFIFGGILGDYPPKKRTKEELTKFIKNTETRNIGKEQLSTDNAVYVTNKILSGTPLNKIEFKDNIEIKLNKFETIELPFRYPIVKGKPNISKELIVYLKNKQGF
jgi:ribosome biogenesis SPOUT family RNA methylase Rps3